MGKVKKAIFSKTETMTITSTKSDLDPMKTNYLCQSTKTHPLHILNMIFAHVHICMNVSQNRCCLGNVQLNDFPALQ